LKGDAGHPYKYNINRMQIRNDFFYRDTITDCIIIITCHKTRVAAEAVYELCHLCVYYSHVTAPYKLSFYYYYFLFIYSHYSTYIEHVSVYI